jgi:hypothetical protein
MGLRYYRRINLGKGRGINVSKSGLSASVRTKWGSYGTKGYSIRSGIPRLSYRSSSGKNGAMGWLIILLFAGAFIVAWYILKFIFLAIANLFGAIFTDDGVNYPNLTAFLGTVFFLLIISYFAIPVKKQQKEQNVISVETPIESNNNLKANHPIAPKKKKDNIVKAITAAETNSLPKPIANIAKTDSVITNNIHLNRNDTTRTTDTTSPIETPKKKKGFLKRLFGKKESNYKPPENNN